MWIHAGITQFTVRCIYTQQSFNGSRSKPSFHRWSTYARFPFLRKTTTFHPYRILSGGGGFFGLELDLNGIRQIEASLEFGAAASINLGVASGAVSIMAGIYFKMTLVDDHNSTQLTGYVRINGAVSVLGLITASIELYMALTYLMDKHKAYGEASLKIKVEVLFFSKTVTLHTQRTLQAVAVIPTSKWH
jgi:hypothetical protein